MKQIIHKYKKSHKAQVFPGEKDHKNLSLLYGLIGLQALDVCRLTGGQLESIRRTVKKIIKKDGKIWLRVVLDRALTAKPAEVRMGKGKGSFSENVSLVRKGTVIVEIGGKNYQEKKAILALERIQKKLPFKSKLVYYKQ